MMKCYPTDNPFVPPAVGNRLTFSGRGGEFTGVVTRSLQGHYLRVELPDYGAINVHIYRVLSWEKVEGAQ